MESQQDVFHPSPGVSRFPLVRQEDAPFFEILFVRPVQREWYQEFEFSDSDSDDFLDLEDFDIVWREDIFDLIFFFFFIIIFFWIDCRFGKILDWLSFWKILYDFFFFFFIFFFIVMRSLCLVVGF